MTTSAVERRSRSSSRSRWMPSRSRPSPCSGCGRRTLSKRRTSASSVASRKTRLGRSPRARAAPMASSSWANHPPARTSTTTATCWRCASGLRARASSRSSARWREQLGRQVVDDEPAEVLEDVGGRAAAGAAHPGDDDDRGIGQGRLGGGPAVGGHSSTSPVVRFTAGSWRCPLSQVADDRRCKRPAEARYGHDVRDVRRAEAFDRTELAQQRLLATGAQPGYAVELGRRHGLGPPLAVEGDGEPVRLVAQPLQQVEALARARQDDRVVLPGQPHLLEALGEADEGDLLDAELVEHRLRRVDLRQSAVDDDEAGRVGEASRAARLRVDRAGGGGLVVVIGGAGGAVRRSVDRGLRRRFGRGPDDPRGQVEVARPLGVLEVAAEAAGQDLAHRGGVVDGDGLGAVVARGGPSDDEAAVLALARRGRPRRRPSRRRRWCPGRG